MGAALLGCVLFAALAGGACAALYGLLTLAGALG